MPYILSLGEIDALLKGNGEQELPNEGETECNDGFKDFDFSNQEIIFREHIPTLGMINRCFARRLRISLFNMIRRTAEVVCNGVSMIEYKDYTRGLYCSTSLNFVHFNPLKGIALIALASGLVSILAGKFFGGRRRRHTRVEGHEFGREQ